MRTLFRIAICLVLMPLAARAHDTVEGKYTKQKTIKKAYFVNPDADIDVKNSYGNVYVTTWAEDKIEMEILIRVSGDNETWVNEKLDKIDVNIEALKNLVTAQTVIGGPSGSGKSSSYEINYTIKIPSKGGVKVNNRYGDIQTTDLFSNVNINCKYGKIMLGKISGSNSVIDIEYCSKSSIESIKSGTIKADYSGLAINDFGKITLNADYTDIYFPSGDDLKYDCSYGKLTLGKLGTLNGSGDYLTIRVDELVKNLRIDTKYSRLNVGKIASKAGDVTIDSEYTGVTLDYDPEYAFNFNISLKYANLKYGSDLDINSKNEGNFSKSYEGIHKKSGVNKVTIASEFGDVSLGRK